MSAWRAVTVVLTLMGLAAMQLWRLSTAAGFPPDIANRQYEFLNEGDVNLGAVVSVHKSVRGRCIEATTTGLSAIEFLEAIVFAMRQVNKEQVIPGVTLGVYILDDCFSASLSLMRALQFMPASGTNHAHHPSRAHPQDHTHLPSHVHSEGHTNPSRRGHISEHVQSRDEARSLDHTHHPGLVNVPDHIHVPQDAQFRDNGSLDDAQPSDQAHSLDHTHLLDSFHSSDTAHVIDHAHPTDNVHSSDHARLIHHAHPPENVLSPDHGHAKDHVRPRRSDFRHYRPSASLLTLPLQGGGSLVSSSKTLTGKPAGSVSPGGTASEHAPPVTASATASTKDAGFRFPLVNNFEEDGSDGSTRNKSSSSHRSYVANSIPNKVARNDAMHSDASELLKTNVSGEVTTPFRSDVMSSDAVKPCENGVIGGIATPCRTDVMSSDVTTPSKPRPVSQSTSWAETSDTLRFFEVAGVIGAFTSQHSIEVAKVLQLFQLPLISPLATSDVLSDKQRFPYFLRTLPPNRDQVKAMGQLVRHFNWTYVSVVYSEDPYGHGSHGLLATTLAALDVCVAQTLTLPASMTSAHYDAVIRSLRRQARARVVLLYVDIKHVLPLLKAVERNGAERELLWVGSDSLSNALWHNPHLCDPNLGSIAVHAHAVTPPAFVAHMTNRIRDRSRGVSRVDSLLDWTMPADLIRLTAAAKEPSSSSSSSSSLPLSLAAFVIDSVYAYAHALRALLSEHCPQARGRGARACVRRHPLHPYLRRVRFNGTSGPFEFDEHGDVVGAIEVRQCQQRPGGGVSSQPIGMWEHRHDRLHVQRARFPRQEAGRAPSSVCAEPCGKGQIYAFTRQTCCWSCVACKANEVTTANASGCLPCAPFQWPDERSRRRCEAIKVPPTPTHPATTLVLQVAAVIGLMMTTVTAVTFCLYRGQRVIRSSSRELSGVMLGGLVSSYLLVFPLLATPTAASCCLTHVGFGLTFTLVYAPLLVKTHRIFRIFRSGRQSAALPPCTSSPSQLGITSALISVQVVIVTVSTAVDPPSAQLHQPVMTQPRVERLCHLPLGGMGTSLAYHVLLVLVCTVLAFKTRRLPDNYSESRYIAFCVDTTLLVWLTFVPAYFTASVGAHKVVVLSLTHLINSYVQLACLFLPRLHALYRQTKQLPDRGGEAGSQLGSYRLINLKGVGLGAGLGSGCVSNNGGCAGDSSGCVVNSSGCIGDSSGCAINSSGCVGDSSGCAGYSSECVNNSSGCVGDSNGCVNNSSGCVVNSSGCVKNSSGCVINSSLCVGDSNGCAGDSSGCVSNSSLCVGDSNGCAGDSSGCVSNSSGCVINSSLCVSNSNGCAGDSSGCVAHSSGCAGDCSEGEGDCSGCVTSGSGGVDSNVCVENRCVGDSSSCVGEHGVGVGDTSVCIGYNNRCVGDSSACVQKNNVSVISGNGCDGHSSGCTGESNMHVGDSGGCIGDSKGCVIKSSGQVGDSSGRVADSSGCVISVSGCDGNSNACVEDNSSGEWLRNSNAGLGNPSEV